MWRCIPSDRSHLRFQDLHEEELISQCRNVPLHMFDSWPSRHRKLAAGNRNVASTNDPEG